MNRNKLAVAILIGVGVIGTISVAQSPTEDVVPVRSGSHPVAVIDLVRVFTECAQIQDLNEMMKVQTEEAAKEAQQRRKVIEDKQTELSAFRPGSQDFLTRRKDLVRLNIDANVWLKVTEQQMDQDKFDWTRIIYDNAVQASSEIAKERGYDVVLIRNDFRPDDIEQSVQALRRVIQERNVIWNASDIDITDMVIRRLDNSYKAGGGKKQLGQSSSTP